jgi:hypothetical protein
MRREGFAASPRPAQMSDQGHICCRAPRACPPLEVLSSGARQRPAFLQLAASSGPRGKSVCLQCYEDRGWLLSASAFYYPVDCNDDCRLSCAVAISVLGSAGKRFESPKLCLNRTATVRSPWLRACRSTSRGQSRSTRIGAVRRCSLVETRLICLRVKISQSVSIKAYSQSRSTLAAQWNRSADPNDRATCRQAVLLPRSRCPCY